MNCNVKYVSVGDVELFQPVQKIAEAVANVCGARLDTMQLSSYAVEIAVALSPLVGFKSKSGKYRIIGGLRSFYLVRQLDEAAKVPMVILPPDSIPDPKIFAAQSALIDVIMRVVDRESASLVVPLLWGELEDKRHRGQLSPRFVSRSGVAEAVGINRRDFSKKPAHFRSEFLALGRQGT
ncbi:hypothetical protein [Marinobacter alexandrii]|uniref:hypothetical protein n=1 Tax=Marinobacter alexandrii TaxID=2570351 RepID=UPI001109CC57|nr:hypothetical protein [Marinobacter alexandrii]